MVQRNRSILLTGFPLLGLLPLALVHGHDSHADDSMGMGMSGGASTIPTVSNFTLNSMKSLQPNYFSHAEFSGLMLAHIVVMIIAWFFILPIGKLRCSAYLNETSINNESQSGIVMNLARYRYSLVTQLCFLGVHILGLFLGAIYTGKTPDLYENNAHNKIGWIVTWIVLVQTVNGVIKLYESGTSTRKGETEEEATFLPISHETMAQHQWSQGIRAPEQYRYSRDSGQGTEPESPEDETRPPPLEENEDVDHFNYHRPQHVDTEEDFDEKRVMLRFPALLRLVSQFSALMPKRAIIFMDVVYDLVNGLILILGFTAITTGIVVYGGVFVSSDISCFLKDRNSRSLARK